MHPEKITDIPDGKQDEVAKGFVADGCTNVDKKQQADGSWTVTASCPDAPTATAAAAKSAKPKKHKGG